MRWTDEFLDGLRNQSDELADASLQKLMEDSEINIITDIFKKMNSNNADPLHKLYPALDSFYHKTNKLPPGVDFKRIQKGEELFARHALPAALIMLTKSLPEGYAAPNLSIVLNISKNLEQYAYRRLLQVLQMLLNVCALGGFSDNGRTIITAQKLRLLHAGIRYIAHEQVPGYSKKYGKVVNHEDMLATIMGFSLLVITGLRILKCPMSPQEEEDYFYLWRVYALMMGIHPPAASTDMSYIPDSVADAELFYEAYARRHYMPATENPDGVELTQANLNMLNKMVPGWLRIFGFGFAPQVYSYHLLGKEAAARVGLKPVFGHHILKIILFSLPRIINGMSRLFFNRREYLTSHHYFSERLFQYMIDNKFGHEITFTVPDSLLKQKEMVRE